MLVNQHMLDQLSLPLAAHRSTEEHIRKLLVQFDQQKRSCEKNSREYESVSIYDLIEHAVMVVVYIRAFNGRSSMQASTTKISWKMLRGDAKVLDTVPSALEFKMAIKDVAFIKPALIIVGRIHDTKMGVANLIYNNGW